jgi:hypothetical protein
MKVLNQWSTYGNHENSNTIGKAGVWKKRKRSNEQTETGKTESQLTVRCPPQTQTYKASQRREEEDVLVIGPPWVTGNMFLSGWDLDKSISCRGEERAFVLNRDPVPLEERCYGSVTWIVYGLMMVQGSGEKEMRRIRYSVVWELSENSCKTGTRRGGCLLLGPEGARSVK